MARKDSKSAVETLAKIEKLAQGVVAEVKRRKNPRLQVPLRTLSNVHFNAKRKIIELGRDKQERTFFWRSAPNSNRTQQAVRQGDWKLVVDANHLLLYNLREDIGERHDHTMQKSDIVRRLRTLVDDWAHSVDADAKAVK